MCPCCTGRSKGLTLAAQAEEWVGSEQTSPPVLLGNQRRQGRPANKSAKMAYKGGRCCALKRHADSALVYRPECGMCSRIGHLYRGPGIQTDSLVLTIAGGVDVKHLSISLDLKQGLEMHKVSRHVKKSKFCQPWLDTRYLLLCNRKLAMAGFLTAKFT